MAMEHRFSFLLSINSRLSFFSFIIIVIIIQSSGLVAIQGCYSVRTGKLFVIFFSFQYWTIVNVFKQDNSSKKGVHSNSHANDNDQQLATINCWPYGIFLVDHLISIINANTLFFNIIINETLMTLLFEVNASQQVGLTRDNQLISWQPCTNWIVTSYFINFHNHFE